jgi:hypothetical protein
MSRGQPSEKLEFPIRRDPALQLFTEAYDVFERPGLERGSKTQLQDLQSTFRQPVSRRYDLESSAGTGQSRAVLIEVRVRHRQKPMKLETAVLALPTLQRFLPGNRLFKHSQLKLG